ncbi:fimbrillin family protein [Bacteroides sp.]|uniref:fimbrillin family protein n=1 Tax=Bacteroides sp. TaxID=29523 RepID=UPI003AB3CFE1
MKYTLLYILSICLLAAGCNHDVSEVPEGTDSGNWLPVLTRAAKGTKATIAGFSSETADKATFSETVICDNEEDNTWKWESTSFTPPPLERITLLTASIPPISMGSAVATLYQSSLSSYPNGLQLGSAPAKINAVNAINVKHRLARLKLDCEDGYTLNNTIDLYLAPTAEVDFRTATIKTASGKKTSYTHSLKENRSIILTILPQTFQKGDLLFQYETGNTQYTYYMDSTLDVGINQSLKVRILPGEGVITKPDDPSTPTDPTVKVSVTATTSITEWQEGGNNDVAVE